MQFNVLRKWEFFWFLSPSHLRIRKFRFPFSKKNSVSWVVKYEKLNFRKAQGIYKISFENCTWKERSSRYFQPSSSKKKILGNICFSEQIFYRNQSLGAPAFLRLWGFLCVRDLIRRGNKMTAYCTLILWDFFALSVFSAFLWSSCFERYELKDARF